MTQLPIRPSRGHARPPVFAQGWTGGLRPSFYKCPGIAYRPPDTFTALRRDCSRRRRNLRLRLGEDLRSLQRLGFRLGLRRLDLGLSLDRCRDRLGRSRFSLCSLVVELLVDQTVDVDGARQTREVRVVDRNRGPSEQTALENDDTGIARDAVAGTVLRVVALERQHVCHRITKSPYHALP